MFVELMPLLAGRTVLITVARVDGKTLRVNVVPHGKADDNPALSTPLTYTGSPEELDAELGKHLAGSPRGERMLNQQTLEKLRALRLHGRAEAFRARSEQPGTTELSFAERFALLVDQQWNWRQNRALERHLSPAKRRHRASLEDWDFRTPRGLDRTLLRPLTQGSAWVREHQNIFLLGPTGMGKSFLACALAEKACQDGFTALDTRAAPLFRDLARARADGRLRTLLARWARLQVLVVDDWAMAPLADTERHDFLGICEDRYHQRSMILTRQLPVAKWHEQIGDPTLADSIFDRLVHNAHRIEMRGESMRKKRGGKE
jgi:PRTRC genetic system protein E